MENQKHPLMQLLGLTMARDRRHRAEEVAKDLGCAVSTYRLAESGSLNLNPSLGFKVAKLFGYEYTNLVLLLVTIQETEKFVNSSDLKYQLQQISIAHLDKSFAFLLNSIEKTNFWVNFDKMSADEFNGFLKERVVSSLFKGFLTSSDFGKSPKAKIQKQDDQTDELIHNLPTLYYDHFHSFLEQLQQLPIRLRFSDLGVWEEKNLDKFENLLAVIKHPTAIVSKENLLRYQFYYLWKNQFQKAKFIFITDGNGTNSEKIKKEFEKNLRFALKKIGDIEKLMNVDKVLEKVEFKIIPKMSDTLRRILTGENHDLRNSPPLEYDGFWVFERKASVPVGFLANIAEDNFDSSYLIYNEGYSINRSEAALKISEFNNIWEAY